MPPTQPLAQHLASHAGDLGTPHGTLPAPGQLPSGSVQLEGTQLPPGRGRTGDGHPTQPDITWPRR